MTNLNPQRKYSIAELTELLYEADRVGNSELVLECCDIIDSRPEDNSYDHIEYKFEGWVWKRQEPDAEWPSWVPNSRLYDES